jgi:segregation and condensation protein B
MLTLVNPMSLKAKIEAVIYASEEPVTLAQLVGLLGEEAQAELDRADEAQGTLSLNETEADLEAAAEQDPTLEPQDSALVEPEAVEAADTGEPAEDTLQAEVPTDTEPEAGMSAPAPAEESQPEESPGPLDAAAVARAERARMSRLRSHFRFLLDQLIADYATGDRGLEIREVAGGFRFATKPEYHDAVRGFVRSLKPPLKLSLQALETLAVVAYKQPVTAPEISEIRGVDSGGVLGSLISRKLITTAGRKQVIGRPILYKTTKEFLLKFGLKDLAELPSIEEFEKLAGQMAEQEEIPMAEETPGRAGEEDAAGGEGYAPHQVEDPAAADDLESAPEEKAGIDGRLASLPPRYDDAGDPSAEDAAIQEEQSEDTNS